MSIIHPGAQVSHQHVRESAGQALGPGAAAARRNQADREFADLQAAKQQLARQRAAEGGPERAAAARAAVRDASRTDLDRAFQTAVRGLRRR